MQAVRIGRTPVYMRPVPLSRRRLWLVQPVSAYRAGGVRSLASWRIRSYRIAAHL